MKISINIPSYRRPKVTSLRIVPNATLWIDAEDYESYSKENPDAKICILPKGIQGNVARVRNYILDQCFDDDVIVMLDDDYYSFGYWDELNNNVKIEDEEKFIDFLEKYSLVAKEYGAFFWGVNVNQDRLSYKSYSPFSTKSFIGGPFQAFLKGNELRYDEKIPLKEDYDMCLQQLNRYRVIFRVNKFHYDCKQSQQSGGCAYVRNRKEEERQLKILQKKWGKKIVRLDERNGTNQKKDKIFKDYNPILKVPIKGI